MPPTKVIRDIPADARNVLSEPLTYNPIEGGDWTVASTCSGGEPQQVPHIRPLLVGP